MACGRPYGRATLCPACAVTLRYCPSCEAVYPRAESHRAKPDRGRTSEYCRPCGNLRRNGPRTPRAVYLAATKARQHAQLRAIIRAYRAGATYAQIAATLAMPEGTLRSIIHYARVTGRWPKTLRRGKDWRRRRAA